LLDFGILTITDLAQENAEILTKDLKISENIITVWIDDAKRKTGQEIPTTKKQVKKPKGKPAEELKEEIAAAIETKPIEKPKAKAVKKPKAKPVKEVKEEIPSAVQKELVEEAKEKVIAAVEEKPAEIPKVKPVKKPKEKPAEEAKEEVKKPLDLPDLKGIGKAELKKLKEVGITKIEDLIEEDPEELSSMTGINKVAVQQWIGDIRAYLGLPREPEAPKKEEAPKAAAPPEDPLSKWLKIEGIGKKIAEKLVKAGIFEVDELLKGDLKALSKKSKISEKDLNKIVESIKKRAAKS
jgi:predicted flap endonuclease-1-like 5' DNA nuclease